MPYKNISDSLAATRRYYARNAEALRKQQFEKRLKQRKLVLEHYSGGEVKCRCCGENTYEFLAIDHINGGGTQHRKSLANAPVVRFLIKNNFPEGYQVLCHNCNHAKHFYGQCPHISE